MDDTSQEQGAAPEDSPVGAYLRRLHARHAGVTEGEVASYIPELAGADPAAFGICLVTADGAVYEAGDTRSELTIQSISKAFTYGLAIDELGAEEVERHIGVEPTGEAFNAITLDPVTGTPQNPMVNAGAITAAGLVARAHPRDGVERLVESYGRFAGRALTVDEAVRSSEDETGHRNRAIAHLLRGSGALPVEPEAALAVYFSQCSVAVDCRDLGVMAATLAAGGRNPLTGERVARPGTVRKILTLMASCGMYDGAGEWLYRVGLPAKSGVGGGIIAVLPGRLAVAVYSPPLDRHGNSVRGVRVCRDLSRELDLHLVHAGRHDPSPIRAIYTLAQHGSMRRRDEREAEQLARAGTQAIIAELQGDLDFRAAELVARRFAQASAQPPYGLLDLAHVDDVDTAIVGLLVDLAGLFAARGGALVLSSGRHHAEALAALAEVAVERGASAPRAFEELDIALEWIEDRLCGIGEEDRARARVELTDHEALAGLSAEQTAAVIEHLEPRTYAAGELVQPAGEPASELLLITAGALSIMLELEDGGERRLDTIAPGMLVGDLAIAGGGPRTTSVRADTDVECFAFRPGSLERRADGDPALRAALLANLVRIAGRRADRLARHLQALAG
ncbi:MAG TPA: glutaminase A [Solirubrobacteraceae bacterium]